MKFLQLGAVIFFISASREAPAAFTSFSSTPSESLVLLKNKNNTLPLNAPRSVAIFGSRAGGPNLAFTTAGELDAYSAGSTAYVASPIHAFIEKAKLDGTKLTWILHDTYTSTSTTNGLGMGGGEGPGSGGPPGEVMDGRGFGSGTAVTPEIVTYASAADYCVVLINSVSKEGADCSELRNVDQDTLVITVADACANTIVVVNSVGPRILDAWIEHDNVTSVVFGSLLGEKFGSAIIDVLYGDVNPSARLPFTIPKDECQAADFELCETEICTFSEGDHIDYKYFDESNPEPRFEFGFGLSYTTFLYGTIVVSSANVSSGYMTGALGVGGRAGFWDEAVTIIADVQNNGTVAGAEIAQLYLTFPDEANQPIRQLRGFEKVKLDVNESGTAMFKLQKRDLVYWDVGQDWAIAAGEYTFSVGASSRDIRATTTLTVS